MDPGIYIELLVISIVIKAVKLCSITDQIIELSTNRPQFIIIEIVTCAITIAFTDTVTPDEGKFLCFCVNLINGECFINAINVIAPLIEKDKVRTLLLLNILS